MVRNMHFVMYSIISVIFDIQFKIFVNNIIAYLKFHSSIIIFYVKEFFYCTGMHDVSSLDYKLKIAIYVSHNRYRHLPTMTF